MIISRKHIWLSLTLCFFIALCSIAYFQFATAPAKEPVETLHPVLPISYVKEEYIRCISLEIKVDTGKCLEALASTAYDSYPTADVAAELSSLSSDEKNIWCHETMHYMGWRAFIVEEDVAKAFLHSTDLCDSGMYHGIVEEYLREHGLQGNIEDTVKHVCEDSLAQYPGVNEGVMSLCYHGLGHGLMYITTADLPASLNYCDLLDKEHRDACYGGVFMEYAVSKAVGPLSDTQKNDLSDFSYCQKLSSDQRASCLSRQGSNNIIVTGGDVKAAMKLCLAIEGEDNQTGCFIGVGTNNPGPSRSPVEASQQCKGALEVSTSSYESCINGSVGFIMQMERGITNGAMDFCSVALESMKSYCYRRIGTTLRAWTTTEDERLSLCNTLPLQEAKESCKQGS